MLKHRQIGKSLSRQALAWSIVATSAMALTAPADAEVITVCLDGSCDFTDIQSAIALATDGDILEVGPGNFSLPASIASSVPVVRPGGKAIRIRGSIGASGEHTTVIDGKGQRKAAICKDAEGPDTVFENLVFTGSINSNGSYCVSISSSSEPHFVNCVIRDNPKGGLDVEVPIPIAPSFERCQFRNNLGGPGVRVRGGSPVFRECLMSHNVATYGAGIYVAQSSITGKAEPQFLNCTVSFNRTTQGVPSGNIYVDDTPVIFSDCLITDNFAAGTGGRGGGVEIASSRTSLLLRCTIARNHASMGGGVYTNSNPAFPGEHRLVDCIITENSAQQGGGVYVRAFQELVLERCRVHSNSATIVAGGLYLEEPVVVTATESRICGNTSPIGAQIWGNGWPSGGNNCVNNSCSVCDPTCVGDLNNDDLVDGADLGALLVAWGTNGSSQPGSDVNDDGVVDGADLGALLVAWGVCT